MKALSVNQPLLHLLLVGFSEVRSSEMVSRIIFQSIIGFLSMIVDCLK